MGNAPAKHLLGLQKITKVYHRIFTRFLGIRDRGSEPSKSDKSIFESYADIGEEAFTAERCEDLEGLNERREETQEYSREYRQRMTKAYGRMTKERVFVEGQLVLKVVDYVRRGMVGPSKFAPKWEEPLMIRETHLSGYYHLAQMDGKDLMDPINGKWLKRYYA